MAKHKKLRHVPADRVRKDGSIVVMTALEATRAARPRIEVACRCGVHGDTKYNRRREKRDFARELAAERL